MRGMFSSAADAVRGHPLILPVYVTFLALLAIGLGCSWEDYGTSFRGYEQFPTLKATRYVVYLVALLPQVGQIAFGFFYGYREWADDGSRRFSRGWARFFARHWPLLVCISLFLVDSGTDVYYKINGDLSLLWLAIGETIVVYTLGSEVCVVVGAGMTIELFPDAVAALKSVGDRFSEAIHGDDDDDDDDDDDYYGSRYRRRLRG
jgi:hypothetical protein